MKWNLFRKLHYFCRQLGSLKFLFYPSFLKQFLHDMFPPNTVFARLFENEATSSSADLLQWNQSLLSDWLDHNSDIFFCKFHRCCLSLRRTLLWYIFSIVLNHCHQQSHAFLVSSFLSAVSCMYFINFFYLYFSTISLSNSQKLIGPPSSPWNCLYWLNCLQCTRQTISRVN